MPMSRQRKLWIKLSIKMAKFFKFNNIYKSTRVIFKKEDF